MKNVSKHSIKCNKRDKVEFVDVCYKVYKNTSHGLELLHEFNTKYEALNYISYNLSEGCDFRIYRLTLDLLVS